MHGPDASPTPDALGALLAHARALIGVELGDLAEQLGVPVPVGAVHTKGWPGQVIEHELGVETGGARGPDFAALGIELKTVPVDQNLVPLESTAVCQIDPVAIAGDSWDSSYARKKLARVLFVALQTQRGQPVESRRVSAVTLWTPSRVENDLLRADFELFVREYFRRGRADAITGHLGRVLQVRPKGKNAADRRDGYDEQGRPTRVGKCGFYLRPAFVASLLRAG
ncbi:MAG TPA: MutH/Sau3AI family endonuclease [Polyangia bacterium]|jgi:DNA mismatch repair protein MutH|nr:MutH/Sau3AI family endonuclease [Polyangia bacterium]